MGFFLNIALLHLCSSLLLYLSAISSANDGRGVIGYVRSIQVSLTDQIERKGHMWAIMWVEKNGEKKNGFASVSCFTHWVKQSVGTHWGSGPKAG